MSSYNGERYIKDQIDSILANKRDGLDVALLVRDDGSTDQTIKILKEYQRDGCLEYIDGTGNIGPAQSFRWLIDNCPLGYDAYGFADQDDLWDDKKLSAAMKSILGLTQPALWYCAILPFYGQIEDTGKKYVCALERAESLRAVIETFGTTNGCTMVINEALLNILRSCGPGRIDMHDSWVHAMVLACGGMVRHDTTPYVFYRIHEAQVLGSGRDGAKARWYRFFHPSRMRVETVKTMLTSNEILPRHYRYLEQVRDYRYIKNKVYLLLEKRPAGVTKKEHRDFKIRIFLHLY